MRSLMPTAALCMGLTIALNLPASAQVLRGRLLEAQGHVGIEGATVRLFNSEGEVCATAITDSAGAFVVAMDVPGRYSVAAERMGYATVRTRPFDLVLADTFDVDVLIAVEPVALDPLIVRSQRQALVLDARLERRGYYEREARYGMSGHGIFLKREDFRRSNAYRTSDLFRDMPRMRLVYAGGRRVQVQTLKGCVPTFYIDGAKYRLRGDETIDDVILPAAIGAVEVYPGTVQPAEYMGETQVARFSRGLCGSVVIWTGSGSQSHE